MPEICYTFTEISKQEKYFPFLFKVNNVLIVIIKTIEKALIVTCELLQIDKKVCRGAITTFGDILLDALIDKAFHPLKVCERMLMCPQTTEKQRIKDYIEEILKDKPPTDIPRPTKKATYKILQLSDPHVDLEYQAVLWNLLPFLNTY